jgi:hypothetical protein
MRLPQTGKVTDKEAVELFAGPGFPQSLLKVVSNMPEDYFKERLRAQEDEIKSLRAIFEAARQRGNKKLMGISRKRLELALRLREMYRRMLNREGASV